MSIAGPSPPVRTLHSVTTFLLDQFLEFLHIAELTPFMGFQGKDFEFFARDPSKRDPWRRGQIRTRLAACWEQWDANSTPS